MTDEEKIKLQNFQKTLSENVQFLYQSASLLYNNRLYFQSLALIIDCFEELSKLNFCIVYHDVYSLEMLKLLKEKDHKIKTINFMNFANSIRAINYESPFEILEFLLECKVDTKNEEDVIDFVGKIQKLKNSCKYRGFNNFNESHPVLSIGVLRRLIDSLAPLIDLNIKLVFGQATGKKAYSSESGK
jgi:AbiV family abortive infection protein